MNTYTIGTSRAGTVHKVYVTSSGQFYNRAICMDGVQGNGRAWVGQIRKVEEVPSGKICKKCFPAN